MSIFARNMRLRPGLAVLASALLLAALAGPQLADPPAVYAGDPECETGSDSCATMTVAFTGYAPGHAAATGLNNCVFVAGVKSGTCQYEYYIPLASRSVSVFAYGDHVRARACYQTTCTQGPGENVTTPVVLTPGTRKTVTFDIQWVNPMPVGVIKTGTGTGIVVSTPAGIDCGSRCDWVFSGGSSIDLVAVPTNNSTFAGFSGEVGGNPCLPLTQFSCRLAVSDGGGQLQATFNAPPTPTPAATPTSQPTAPPTPHPTATPGGGHTPKPTATPGGGSTPKPSQTTVPSSAPGRSSAPGTSAEPGASVSGGSAVPGLSLPPSAGTSDGGSPVPGAGGSSGPSASAPPDDVAASGGDLTPILLIGMLVLVIASFTGGAWWTRRRIGAPPG